MPLNGCVCLKGSPSLRNVSEASIHRHNEKDTPFLAQVVDVCLCFKIDWILLESPVALVFDEVSPKDLVN